MKRLLKGVVSRLNRRLNGSKPTEHRADLTSIPFDNSTEWLNAAFSKLMVEPDLAVRPQYAWGVLHGAALAKVLGVSRISVVEFGVASGAGLLSMERIAEAVECLVGIGIDVFGFDTGKGHLKPRDYRDMPHRWFAGYYPCDQQELQRRLKRSRLIYGDVEQTIGPFIAARHPPVAFVGWDFSVYTATRAGLRLFDGESAGLLPRTLCSFRSSIGPENCEYTGELLAISEFNASHERRKLCKIHGLNYFVPTRHSGHWVEWLYTLHIFEHPLYTAPQSYSLSAAIDIDGRETSVEARFGENVKSALSSDRLVMRKNSQ